MKVLVGYDRDCTYRFYDLSTDKIYLSREVISDEERILGKNEKSSISPE